jgi:hypothetical protein
MKKLLLLVFTLSATFVLYAQQVTLADTLKQYTGKYKFPDGSVVTEVVVTLDSTGVLTVNSAQGSSELKKSQGDVFDVVAYGGTATFKRNAENKIIGVQIIVGDVNIEGTKTEEGQFTGLIPAILFDTRRLSLL